jgi:hypothetical protein
LQTLLSTFTLIARASSAGWTLHAERIACPVRMVWGTEDRLLRWPAAHLARGDVDSAPDRSYRG